jgi:hypothetical protein
MNLVKAFCHQSCLIDVNISITARLFLENSFTTDRSHTIDWINQVPNLIVMYGLYFRFHGSNNNMSHCSVVRSVNFSVVRCALIDLCGAGASISGGIISYTSCMGSVCTETFSGVS